MSQYDIEFRGFIESDVVNSVNPLNSLSYLREEPPHGHQQHSTERPPGVQERL